MTTIDEPSGNADSLSLTAVVPGQAAHSDFGSRLALWLLCGVGLGVLPVVANLISPLFSDQTFSVTAPLGDGELLIAATAIAGGAVGELLQVRVANCKAQLWINVSGGSTILLCALSAFAYAVTKNSMASNASAQVAHASGRSEVVFGSVVLFTITVAAATACIRTSSHAEVDR
jgi:hypothetical protein